MTKNNPDMSDHVPVIMETVGIFIPRFLRVMLLVSVLVFLHPRLWLRQGQLEN